MCCYTILTMNNELSCYFEYLYICAVYTVHSLIKLANSLSLYLHYVLVFDNVIYY